MRGSPRLIIALVIALIGVFSYFGKRSTNDVTGEVQHVSLTPDQEIALGLESQPDMAQQFGGETRNSAVDDYVEQVGQRVVRQSIAGRSPYKFDFHLLSDPETINAFALPGGQVSITVGLLKRLHNEAELAGVLGHEIGHVIGRHGAEQLAKQQLSGALVGAGVIAASDRGGSTMRNAAVAQAVAQLVSMKFGRQDELEADDFGVQLMKQAGYDPQGMEGVMQTLAEASKGGRTPEFFSTHPSPQNRLALIQQEVAKVGPGGETAADRFRTNTAGLQ